MQNVEERATTVCSFLLYKIHPLLLYSKVFYFCF
jgi:hypothetical protein